MKTTKNVGIWMDHSSATLIDLQSNTDNTTIDSSFNFSIKEEALSRSESIMHNKENQMQDLYYKKLGDEILKYDHVLLFGPTQAKTELHNFLEKDSHFKKIQFDLEPADKMTENEKIAFVKHHFGSLGVNN